MSYPLTRSVPVFPGYPKFEADPVQTFDKDGKRSHQLLMNSHMGTHVDAPSHFIEDGRTIGELPVEELCGTARVVDLRSHKGETITRDILEDSISHIDENIVLLLTGDVDQRFGESDFFERAAVLNHGAAKWLAQQGVQVVANDFLTESIESSERPVHKELLGKDIPIVEYLCNIDPVVEYDAVEFRCYPLLIPHIEAAPARVICNQTVGKDQSGTNIKKS